MAKTKFLSEDMLTPQLMAQLRQWKAEAENEGDTLAKKALKWTLSRNGVTSVIVGASSIEQLKENIGI